MRCFELLDPPVRLLTYPIWGPWISLEWFLARQRLPRWRDPLLEAKNHPQDVPRTTWRISSRLQSPSLGGLACILQPKELSPLRSGVCWWSGNARSENPTSPYSRNFHYLRRSWAQLVVPRWPTAPCWGKRSRNKLLCSFHSHRSWLGCFCFSYHPSQT
jgi:hypothetical protein